MELTAEFSKTVSYLIFRNRMFCLLLQLSTIILDLPIQSILISIVNKKYCRLTLLPVSFDLMFKISLSSILIFTNQRDFSRKDWSQFLNLSNQKFWVPVSMLSKLSKPWRIKQKVKWLYWKENLKNLYKMLFPTRISSISRLIITNKTFDCLLKSIMELAKPRKLKQLNDDWFKIVKHLTDLTAYLSIYIIKLTASFQTIFRLFYIVMQFVLFWWCDAYSL